MLAKVDFDTIPLVSTVVDLRRNRHKQNPVLGPKDGGTYLALLGATWGLSLNGYNYWHLYHHISDRGTVPDLHLLHL